MSYFIVDAHQDIAWNTLTFGRDYTRSALETRRLEANTLTPERNGDSLMGWPDYQQGRVGLIFSVLFSSPIRRQTGAWETVCYRTTQEAHQQYRQQIDLYRRLTDQHHDKFRLISDRRSLNELLVHWQDASQPSHPVGLTMLMEGAEGVREPAELEEWWSLGVRIIGPAWAGNRFCGGTREPGPLTSEGYALLDHMAGLGFALDLSHMDAKAALQALDHYPGVVFASHANAASLLKGAQTNRHLTDEVIDGLLEHDGVIGIVPHSCFLLAGWLRPHGRHLVTLEHVLTQIDYICQRAGDARHVAIGTDFDGGFGWQEVPEEINTIADLQLLGPRLAARGYTADDLQAIFSGNWLRKLNEFLPETA